MGGRAVTAATLALGIAVVAQFVNSVSASAFELLPLTNQQLMAGEFSLPVEPVLHHDTEADRALLTILGWLESERAAEDRRCAVLGDKAGWEISQNISREKVRVLVSACNQYKSSDASLTALLLLGVVVDTRSMPSLEKVRDALIQVREKHPASWQARVEPLVEFPLTYHIGKARDKAFDRMALSQQFMVHIPPPDAKLSRDNVLCKAFLDYVQTIRLPLRAEYLLRAANGQYGIATRSTDAQIRSEYFDSAAKTYRMIIEEYPGSDHAKRAQGSLADIDTLRNAKE